MKKLVLLMIVLLASIARADAQSAPSEPTAAETVEWLRGKLATASRDHYTVKVTEHQLVIETYRSERLWTDSDGAGYVSTWDVQTVSFGSIKSINPDARCTQYSACSILFYGDFSDCQVEHGAQEQLNDPTCTRVQSIKFEIYQNDWANAGRFIKAFKRLAELDGAQFTNSNLY
ncbi:MAG TPA: hypothetical protein VGB94_00205 [Acidobacteriaceae bacterium]